MVHILIRPHHNNASCSASSIYCFMIIMQNQVWINNVKLLLIHWNRSVCYVPCCLLFDRLSGMGKKVNEITQKNEIRIKSKMMYLIPINYSVCKSQWFQQKCHTESVYLWVKLREFRAHCNRFITCKAEMSRDVNKSCWVLFAHLMRNCLTTFPLPIPNDLSTNLWHFCAFIISAAILVPFK